MEEYAMYDNAKASIWEDTRDLPKQDSLPGLPASDESANWMTDDTCHWYRDGACGYGAGRQLETYEVSTNAEDKGNGKIYLDPDGVAYGPVYGCKLVIGF